MGSGTATWTHQLRCVDRYAVRLVRNDDPDVKGEMFLPAPEEIGDEVLLVLGVAQATAQLELRAHVEVHAAEDGVGLVVLLLGGEAVLGVAADAAVVEAKAS